MRLLRTIGAHLQIYSLPISARYGPFDLDVCASDENALCDNYFTKDISALDGDWDVAGRLTKAFMNPPYSPSSLQRKFLQKAREQATTRGVTTVSLVPVSTGSRWWWQDVYGKATKVIFLVNGRIKFIDPSTGVPGNAGMQDSCLLIFTEDRGSTAFTWWDWKENKYLC